MSNRRSLEIAAVLATLGAVGTLFVTTHEFGSRLDRELHAAIGQALAREALSLCGQQGRIIVITRDTTIFPQPALEILGEALRREVRRAGVTLAPPQLVQADPLRPVEAPAGDIYELIRRGSAGQVIVSLLGPPWLTEDQQRTLGVIKPRIVAFCAGNQAETIDLDRLFAAGLLHAAVVRRPTRDLASVKSARGAKAFAQLYQTLRPGEVGPVASKSVFGKCCRPVLRRGGPAGFVAAQSQISWEYAPSPRRAIRAAALANRATIISQSRSSGGQP